MAEKDNSTFLYVLPRAIQNKDWEISYKKITGEMMAKRNIMEDPFEYMGIRNYQNFDNIRAVNWKATAKTRELKVNKKGYSSSRNVKIILCFEESDISFREELEEAGMDIAASLIEKFTKEGISLSVSTNGRDFLDSSMIKVMTGCGRDHAKQILRQLARVDFSQKRGTWQDILGNGLEKEEQDFVFIISSNICESMQRKMKETMHGKEFYWICPTRKEEPVKVENSLKSNFYPIAVERLGL